ncbi:zinc-finger domain-containing protein [Kordiimonas sp. SCSIO 12610]|uniref:zinc-finger domain-containing protein n=1 Tax=Kordiimonas sp. SCSIO 12610 TaxID=2829597 RepID=UPI00210AAE0A|nr:zinc-finger domain-containing protein [Kordiimonas sp. SCSIO 12610]UTW55600.1 zinc-finger domain-containing protein [Kordiimonas sp. SCSIO 12610]
MSITAPEIVRVDTKKVACDGDEGALGHPRVYLTMDQDGKVECPYCDRLYLLIGSEADKAHG